MFEAFWLFFVVVFRTRAAEAAAPATLPGGGLDSLFEANEECHRGNIVPC